MSGTGSPHLPFLLRDPLSAAGKSLGLPIDQIALLICLLSALPIGAIHKRLPNATVKHVYTLFFGLLFVWFVIGPRACGELFLYSVANYYLCNAALSNASTRRRMPLLMTLLNMSYMSALHLYRMYVDYLGWSLDITLSAMIIIVKLNMYAYNLADGDKIKRGEQLSAKPHIAAHRSERALVERPTLLEMLAYTFFYPSVIVGPCTEMKQYLDYSDMSLFTSKGFKSIPSSSFASLISIRNALFCYIGLFVSGLFPIMGYVNTDAFYAQPLWYRYVYFWISTTSCRYKYYFAWYLAEAGVQATGLSFEVKESESSESKKKTDGVTPDQPKALNGHTAAPSSAANGAAKQIVWGGCNNVEVTRVELGTHIPILTNYWNKGVNNWLKHYVYNRVSEDLPKSLTRIVPAKSFSNIVTKLMSACWHGYYSSYYAFFLGAWLCNEMDDALRKTIEEPILKTGNKTLIRCMSVFQWFIVYSCMNFLGAAFMLLRLEYSIRFWRSLGYFGFILPCVIILLCKLAPKQRTKRPSASSTPSQSLPSEGVASSSTNGSAHKDL